MQVEVGRVLGEGRFEVLSRLGEGGGGVVYEVRDRESDARLALKTVHLHQPSALASLKREFRAVQDVTHPNLVRLDELFEDNGVWFFTMELVRGQDWLSYVRPGSPPALDEARLRGSLAQIVEALAVLHATGTVHRDVKPSNVLVSPAGQVKLLDFGIATDAHRRQPEAEGVVGTAAFMPPEQVLAEEPTPAGDLYAVGAMLYQALTGRLPFFEQAGHVLEAKLHGPPTRVHDVAPSAPADLAALCDALLRVAPGERPDATAALEAIGARQGSVGEMPVAAEVFVGRDDELGVLHRAFDVAAQGGAVAVIVEGVSGVGKSALVRRCLRDIEGKALALEGKCHQREYVPYNGIDAVVEGLANHLVEEDSAWLESLSAGAVRLLPRMFPALARVPFFSDVAAESQTMAEGAPHELRARIFGAFRELLTRLAERKPLVLAIDDIQWADGDTRALLAEILAPPAPPRILLICARRLTEEEAARPSLAPPAQLAGDVRSVRVGALPGEQIASLAVKLSRTTTLARSELDAIAAECGGHPLFLQELVRRSARGGARASGYVRLDDALWDRVALLGEHEQSIVHAVAVAEVPTPLDLIAAAGAVPRPELPALMATLHAANMVKVTGKGRGRSVSAYHDRVREAVVSHLSAQAKRDWHERLARAFEASPERDVERLAVHWDGAGDAPRAATLYREAAERASSALAFDRAVDFYERSLALSDAAGPDRDALENALAIALVNAGRGGEAARVFLTLARRATGQTAITLRGHAAHEFLCSGHFAEGAAELRGVLSAAHLGYPQSRLAVILMILWQRFRIVLRGLAFTPRAPEEIDPRELTRVDVCWAVAHGFGMTDATTAGAFHAMGARLSLNLGDRYRAARALSGYALTASIAGRKGRKHTAEVIRTIRALNAELRNPFIDAFIRAAEGFAAYMVEDWPTANARFSESIVGFRDRCVGATYELGTVRNMLGRTLAHQGRLSELAAQIAPTLRDAVRRGDLYNVINVRTTAGALLALAHDDVDVAEDEIDRTEAALSKHGFQLQHVYWLIAAGMLDLYRGEPEAALARFETHSAPLKRSLLESVQSVRVMTTHFRARMHLALARKDAARKAEHVARASHCARQLRSEGLPAAEAFAILVDAGAACVRGEVSVGAAGLRDAIERFDAADMRLYAAVGRYALGGLVGGDEGARLVEAARGYFAAEGVVACDRFVGLCAPGFTA